MTLNPPDFDGITARQNGIQAGIAPAHQPRVEQLLAEHGIMPVDKLALALRNPMACPAIPLCGPAGAEAERALVALIRTISEVLDELGLRDERICLDDAGGGLEALSERGPSGTLE